MIDYEGLRLWAGPYRAGRVRQIERYVVTEEMIDQAIQNDKRAGRVITEPRRNQARRAIAIGIAAGSYRDWTGITI